MKFAEFPYERPDLHASLFHPFRPLGFFEADEDKLIFCAPDPFYFALNTRFKR